MDFLSLSLVLPTPSCRRGVPGLLPHPAAHVPGHGGDQRGRNRSLLHPGGQRLRPAARLLHDKRVGILGRVGTLAALPDLKTLTQGCGSLAKGKSSTVGPNVSDTGDTGRPD